MTRIDSATITLSVWDDTLGMRREVTFDVPLGEADNALGYRLDEGIIRAWWREHEQRIRLAARDEPGGFVL